MAVASKPQLSITNYGANEVVFGLPLGACAARDPRLETLTKQLAEVGRRVLANTPSLIVVVLPNTGLAGGSYLLGRACCWDDCVYFPCTRRLWQPGS